MHQRTLFIKGTGNYIHATARVYGTSTIGKNCMVMENAILGYPSNKILSELRSKNLKVERYSFKGAHIGNNAVIRSNSIIYCDVKIGDNLRTGHNVMVREMTYAGDNVLIGTNSIVDGYTVIGNNVSIQGNVYIPTNTIIEDNVFFGPCSAVTNDKYPIRVRYDLKGAIIRKGVTIGANATVLPGVEIGEGAMVGAGALVTKDVPAWMLAIGSPAKTVELPERLRHYNRI